MSTLNKYTRRMIGNVALDTRNGNIYVFDGQFIWIKH